MQNICKTELEDQEIFDSLKIKNSGNSKIADYRYEVRRRAEEYRVNNVFNEVFEFLEQLDGTEIQQSHLIYDIGRNEVESCQLEIRCNPENGKIYGPRFFWEIKLQDKNYLRFCPSCLIDSWIRNDSVEEMSLE